jgi:hypothetical protein
MVIRECVADLLADIAKRGSEELAKRSNMVHDSFQIGLLEAQKEFSTEG